MANLSDRYKNELLAGYNDAMVDPRELIKRLERRREVDNAQIVRALEIAGAEIALLKKAKVALARPVLEPETISPRTLAMSEKLRSQSIAASRGR